MEKNTPTETRYEYGVEFGWQPHYHEHIIQNKAEFHKIRKYINENVANWTKDIFCTCPH